VTAYRKGLLRRLPILLIVILARRPALLEGTERLKLEIETSEQILALKSP
jgi:hypothetical protein